MATRLHAKHAAARLSEKQDAGDVPGIVDNAPKVAVLNRCVSTAIAARI